MSHYLYRLYDANDQLLYVGISKSAIHRLHQHLETQPWGDEIAYQKIERFEDRKTVAAAERQAIKTEHPKYNIVHNVNAPAVGSSILKDRRCLRLFYTSKEWLLPEKMDLRKSDWVCVGLNTGVGYVGQVLNLYWPDRGSPLVDLYDIEAGVTMCIKLDDVLAIEYDERTLDITARHPITNELDGLFKFKSDWQRGFVLAQKESA